MDMKVVADQKPQPSLRIGITIYGFSVRAPSFIEGGNGVYYGRYKMILTSHTSPKGALIQHEEGNNHIR